MANTTDKDGTGGADGANNQGGAASGTPAGIAPDELADIDRMLDAFVDVTQLTQTALQKVETYGERPVAARPAPEAPPDTAQDRAAKVGVKLVLFSDGTGNSSAKAEKTNVWRMFQALDQSTSDQLAIYDDGVGTSRNRTLAALGGAFGWGLKRNVIDLYKFVCRNYVDETTRIYGFGFSRGAFTIRMLVGLITTEGLIRFTCEEELHRHAVAAYSRFRDECFKPLPLSPVHVYRALRNGLASLAPRTRPEVRKEIKIEFLGLWDTVSAYGMPIAELKPAISWLCWPMYFRDLKLSKDVKRACHALSLDDERTTFHPIVWDQSQPEDQVRISQVWFAGVHSNVGGGYPEDQLSLVSLDWMMQHAKQAGLALRADEVARTSSEKSAFARIYDSRAGAGGFYRYSPRTISMGAKPGAPVLPVIHGSVIARMARGSDAYVPSALEHDFVVLAPNGDMLSLAATPSEAARNRIRITAPHTPQVVETAVADERTEALKHAIEELTKPDKKSLDPIHNLVWLRRIAYVASVMLAALIALFPLFADGLQSAIKQGARAARHHSDTLLGMMDGDAGFVLEKMAGLDKELIGLLARPITDLMPWLPAWAVYWARALKDAPVELILVVLVFAGCVSLNAQLRNQVRDFGRFAWHPALQQPYRKKLLAAEIKRARDTRRLLVAFDVVAIASLAVRDTSHGEPRLWFIVLAVNLLAMARIGWHLRFRRILRDPNGQIASGILAHLVARAARENGAIRTLSRLFRSYGAPIAFGAALLYVCLAGLNKVAFSVEDTSGAVCASSRHGKQHLPTVTDHTDIASAFWTNQMCWASGRRLAAGTRYRVILTGQEAWRDDTKPTGMAGFDADSFAHLAGTPLKRWWREPWFAPIAHVGVKGNEEFPLHPCSGGVAANPNVMVAEFTTNHDGELFLFVNDAVLALPRIQNYFYVNNHGNATVQVEPVRGDGPAYRCPT